jgi:Uma2 family endonuclease
MTLPLEPNRRYTVEEYLDIDGKSLDEKFEYHDGHIFGLRAAATMWSGSIDNCLITTNATCALANKVMGTDYFAYASTLRVCNPSRRLYAYPDGTLVRGKARCESHPSAGETLVNPSVVIEVVSPATELYDRGDKFWFYREIPSLVEYLLISQSEPRIECYCRDDDGGWTLRPYEGMAAVAKLLSLNIELPLKEVYAGIEFPVA